jgi:hypothetical protein
MMSNRLIIALLAVCLSAAACSKGGQINASSKKTLYRSVTTMKDRLPEKQRVEFEVAFWSLKQSEPDEAAFRKAVDGKTVQEIIQMGKANFEKRRAAGDEAFQKHGSWDEMIAELVAERQRVRLYGQSRRDQQNQLKMNR